MIQLLPANPYNILKSYFRGMFLKINEIIAVVNAGGGGSSQIIESYICGEAIGGQRIVYTNNGKAFYYDANDQTQTGKILGITIQAGALNDPINVVSAGNVVNIGWGLVPNSIYYTTTNGLITNSLPPPPLTFQRVGVAVDSDTLKLEFSEPVETI